MKKTRLFTLSLAISFLISFNSGVFAADVKNISTPKETPKETSKELKGNVKDSKAEYINQDWWARFNDPVLSGYIAKSALENYDMKIASLKVSESQELVKASLGAEFPSLSLEPNFLRNKTSDNVSMGNFHLSSYQQSNWNIPINANYEVDLWRKNRDKTIQKSKEFEAVKYDEKTIYISLTSCVASTYFNLINMDKQIDLQKQILNSRKEILAMIKKNYEYGLSTATDVTQADKSLIEAESGLKDLYKNKGIFSNQLAVLMGESSDNSASLQRTSIDKIGVPENLPDNVRSEVVKERPDILKAEAELQKAKIDVNLARKNFFPDISINGLFGFNSNTLSKTFDNGSNIGSFGASIAQTVFSGGKNKAILKAQKYKYDQMMQNYQKIILTSFQEVNDSLASLKFDTQKDIDNIDRLERENDNLKTVNNKYQAGAISYLDTLQFKERVLTLEKERIQSKTDCLIDSLSLYKSLGGKL